ncbi:MAG: hypothetical protein LBN71_02260 [Tannerella sp.]|nr:hypothetical protein [Tannerella sp.]
MKKYLFLAGLFIAAFFSCEGPEGPPGPSEELNWKIITKTVRTNDWALVSDNGKGRPGDLNTYYMYELTNVRELTDFVYEEGLVFVYLVQSPGAKNEVLTPLPYVVPIGDEDSGDFWMETVTFDYLPGSVAFYVNYSDFETGIMHPGELTFRIVMIW